MKLYPLKQIKLFHQLETPQKIKLANKHPQYKIKTIYESERIIRFITDEERCFFTLSSTEMMRETLLILEETPIKQCEVFANFLVLVGGNGYVGCIELKKIEIRFQYFDVSKIIISTNDCVELRRQKTQKKGKKSNVLLVFTSGQSLFLIERRSKGISFLEFNKQLTITWKYSLNFDIGQQSTVLFEYCEGECKDICFLVSVFGQQTSKIYLCQIGSEKDIKMHLLVEEKVNEKQKQLKYTQINGSMIIIFRKSFINLFQKDINSKEWNLIGQMVPQGYIVSVFGFQNMLYTFEKYNKSYCILQYDIQSILSFTKLTPTILGLKQQYSPLSLVENHLNLLIILWGEDSFLIYQNIYQITSMINQYQLQDEYGQQKLLDLFENNFQYESRRVKKYNRLKLNTKIKDQIEDVNQVSLKIKKLYEIYQSLGLNDDWIFIIEVISQFLTDFIYLVRYGNALQQNKLSQQPLKIPIDLKDIISQVTIICDKKLYQFPRVQIQLTENSVPNLKLLSKISINMITLASYFLQHKETYNKPHFLSDFTLPQCLYSLFNQTYLIQFLLLKIKLSHHSHNNTQYHSYIKLLTSLLQYKHDYPPVLYLITGQIYNFIHNKYHLQRIYSLKNEEDKKNIQIQIIQFLKNIKLEEYLLSNELSHIEQFNLSSKFINQNQQSVVYVRTNYNNYIKLNGFQSFQKILKSTQELPSNIDTLNYNGNVYVQICEEQVYQMIIQMQGRIHQELAHHKNSNFYNFCRKIRNISTRVKKLITFQNNQNQLHQIQQNQRLKLYTKQMMIINTQKRNYLLEVNRFKEKRIFIQQNNLLDQLIHNYFLQIQNIFRQSNIHFVLKSMQKMKELEFSQFLTKQKSRIAPIQPKQNLFFAEQLEIYHKSQSDKPYLQYFKQSLWEMYLFFLNQQQHHFQIFQHIRSNIFAEQLMQLFQDNLIGERQRNYVREGSNIEICEDRTKGRELLLQLRNQRQKYTIIPIEGISPECRIQNWLKLIKLCNKYSIRWLGDPLDLFQELIQISYNLTQFQSKVILQPILSLFNIFHSSSS